MMTQHKGFGGILARLGGMLLLGLLAGLPSAKAQAQCVVPPQAFFTGEQSVGSCWYWLSFTQSSGQVPFGYYTYTSAGWMDHLDLGWEYVFDANSSTCVGCVYFYDNTSTHYFFTSPSLFPYLYDYTLNVWLWYVPDVTQPGQYTANPRFFVNLTTGQVISLGSASSAPNYSLPQVPANALTINGTVVGTTSTVTLSTGTPQSFAFTYSDPALGSNGISWGEDTLLDSSLMQHCSLSWGRPNALDLFPNIDGSVSSNGATQSDSFCAVSLPTMSNLSDGISASVAMPFTFFQASSSAYSVITQVYDTSGNYGPWVQVGSVSMDNSVSPTLEFNVAGYTGAVMFETGDTYTLTVSGAANQLVAVNQNGSLASVGYTNSVGIWSTTATWGTADVGNYVQTWYVGGVAAAPTLTFTVLPNPGASIPGSFTAAPNPLACNDISGSWWDTLAGPTTAEWTSLLLNNGTVTGGLNLTFGTCGVLSYSVTGSASGGQFSLTAEQPQTTFCGVYVATSVQESVTLSGQSCSVGTAQWKQTSPIANTLQGTSSWQAATPRYTISVSSYIPVDHIPGPTPCLLNGVLPSSYGLIYKGDAFRNTYRTTQSILAVPDAMFSYGFYANTGPTRNYSTGSPANGLAANLDSTPTNRNDLYNAPYVGKDEDSVQYDCVLWNDKGQATTNQMQSYQVTFPAAQQEVVTFTGTGNDPLEPKFGGINWNMAVLVNDSNPNAPQAYVNYNHTCYPAINVKVNGTTIYDYQPPQNNTTYLSLCLLDVYSHIVGQSVPMTVPRQ